MILTCITTLLGYLLGGKLEGFGGKAGFFLGSVGPRKHDYLGAKSRKPKRILLRLLQSAIFQSSSDVSAATHPIFTLKYSSNSTAWMTVSLMKIDREVTRIREMEVCKISSPVNHIIVRVLTY